MRSTVNHAGPEKRTWHQQVRIKTQPVTHEAGANYNPVTKSLMRTLMSVSRMKCRYWIQALMPNFNVSESPRKQLSSLNAATRVLAPTKKNLRYEKLTSFRAWKILPNSYSHVISETRGYGQNWITSSAKKTLSTTAPGFRDRLRENGVLLHNDSLIIPPSNLEKLRQQLRFNRSGTMAPTEEEWRIFRELAMEASNERDIGMAVERHLFEDRMNPKDLSRGYRAFLDKQWLDFPKNQGFNDGLSNPKPDYIEGYKRSKFPPNISGLGGVVTLDNKAPDFIVLPHFAAEYKVRGSSLHMNSAKVQAGYVGAAMSHGRSIALQFLGSPDPPRHAGVITAVTDGRRWEAYAHYQDENLETGDKLYCQYLVAKGSLCTREDFQHGYRILRNAQGFAHEQSSNIRDRLKQKVASPFQQVALV